MSSMWSVREREQPALDGGARGTGVTAPLVRGRHTSAATAPLPSPRLCRLCRRAAFVAAAATAALVSANLCSLQGPVHARIEARCLIVQLPKK